MSVAVAVHESSRWPLQRAALEEVQGCRSTRSLAKIMLRTSHQGDELQYEEGPFRGVDVLMDFFDEPDEWWSLVKYIAELALRTVSLFGEETQPPLDYLPSNVAASVSISRMRVASLLALAFFDMLPRSAQDDEWDMPEHLSFRFWLSGAAVGTCDGQKALCLIQYFLRTRDIESRAGQGGCEGSGDGRGEANPYEDCIVISRLVLPPTSTQPVGVADWIACDLPLRPLEVRLSGGIEDAKDALQADFANEYIGGGVMCGGNVQEEIRFSICPECLVANLLCPRMRANEAIVLSGIRQYAGFTGYGGSFECTGAHHDIAGSTAHVLAVDATPYLGSTGRQYRPEQMLRELTKLCAGLSDEAWPAASPHTARTSQLPYATGNWGCGVFGGDLRLKALLQWLAASRAGRDTLYFPYGDPRAHGLREVSAKLLGAKVTVGSLARALFECGAPALKDGGAFDVALDALRRSQ